MIKKEINMDKDQNNKKIYENGIKNKTKNLYNFQNNSLYQL